ncbi:hypothetical protein ACFL0U_03190 [Pseudomonadota bacterium]
MSNIQEELNEKLKNVKQNFLDAVSNLDRQIFNKIDSIKERYTLQITELTIKQEEGITLEEENHKTKELEKEITELKREREEIVNIIKEKEEKIYIFKNKMEDFTDKIFQKAQEVENLINN